LNIDNEHQRYFDPGRSYHRTKTQFKQSEAGSTLFLKFISLLRP